jgi:5-formyltetrahydrofolate cyclo-ligase
MNAEIEQESHYSFAPVLEPEPEPLPTVEAQNPPVQADIVAAAKEESPAESDKKAIRAAVRERLDTLSEKERRAGERRIAEKLMQHPDVHRAKTVLLYANHGSEVATDELAKELIKKGKLVAYPKITNVPGLMTLWRVRNLDALVPHKHGIRAPDITLAAPTEPINIDCVIYPGLAFTKGLARLGRGGGYYDRLSGKLADNCTRIGVCFETQLVDQLPQETHDAKMHWVVTELTVYPYVPDPPVIQAPPGSVVAPKTETAVAEAVVTAESVAPSEASSSAGGVST